MDWVARDGKEMGMEMGMAIGRCRYYQVLLLLLARFAGWEFRNVRVSVECIGSWELRSQGSGFWGIGG